MGQIWRAVTDADEDRITVAMLEHPEQILQKKLFKHFFIPIIMEGLACTMINCGRQSTQSD